MPPDGPTRDRRCPNDDGRSSGFGGGGASVEVMASTVTDRPTNGNQGTP